MLNRLVLVLFVVPIAIVLITLAVANRGAVPFTLDPFNPGNKALTVEWPLFVYLFVTLAVGLVIGSFATWVKQGRYRREARARREEVQRLIQQSPRREPEAARPEGAGGLPAVSA